MQAECVEACRRPDRNHTAFGLTEHTCFCDYGCSASRLECQECIPGETECHGNSVVTCGPSGLITDTISCLEGCYRGVCEESLLGTNTLFVLNQQEDPQYDLEVGSNLVVSASALEPNRLYDFFLTPVNATDFQLTESYSFARLRADAQGRISPFTLGADPLSSFVDSIRWKRFRGILEHPYLTA